ncbi:hypothetical protein NL676_019812 [Syzygium grande]|nr:hypothetical protein NL676_019812 [Syzygium grande]
MDPMAKALVEHYYSTFNANRVDLANLYQEGSMLTFQAQSQKGEKTDDGSRNHGSEDSRGPAVPRELLQDVRREPGGLGEPVPGRVSDDLRWLEVAGQGGYPRRTHLPSAVLAPDPHHRLPTHLPRQQRLGRHGLRQHLARRQVGRPPFQRGVHVAPNTRRKLLCIARHFRISRILSPIKIFVKTLKGTNFEIVVEPEDAKKTETEEGNQDLKIEAAKRFLENYYGTFGANWADLASLYREESVMIFEGRTLHGKEAILAELTSLQQCRQQIVNFACHPAHPGSGDLVATVSGNIWLDGKQDARLFGQVEGSIHVHVGPNTRRRLLYIAQHFPISRIRIARGLHGLIGNGMSRTNRFL